MALRLVPGPTIPAGQSVSDAVNLYGNVRIVRIMMPDAWSGGPLSFQISEDGAAWHDLFHVAVERDTFPAYEVIIPTVSPGSAVVLPAASGELLSFVRFRSGTRASPVKQSADRVFQIVLDG